MQSTYITATQDLAAFTFSCPKYFIYCINSSINVCCTLTTTVTISENSLTYKFTNSFKYKFLCIPGAKYPVYKRVVDATESNDIKTKNHESSDQRSRH